MTGASYDDEDADYDFETILDGTNLHGWKMCGQGMFVLGHKMIISEGGMGLLWYTKRKFLNFILKVDWKTTTKGDNSGVFVRFADPDDDPWIAVNTGYEIQIYDAEPPDGNATHRTGAIYNFAVILKKERVKVLTDNRQSEGFIGLQNHDAKSKVCFGKIAIKEL